MFVSKHPDWRALFWDNHPPLFHLILKFVVQFVPLDELYIRILPIAISTITIAVFTFEVLRRFDRHLAIAMAIVFTFNPVSFGVSQLVRPYCLFELLSVLQFFSWLDFLDGKPKSRQSWICFSVLVCGTHYLGLLSSVVQFFLILLHGRKGQKRALNFLTLLAPIVFGSLLALIGFRFSHLGWMQLRYIFDSPGIAGLEHLEKFFGNSSMTLIVSAIFVFASGFVLYFKKQKEAMLWRRCFEFLICTHGLLFLFSIASQMIVFVPRFTVFMMAPLVIGLCLSIRIVAKMRKDLVLFGLVFLYLSLLALSWFPERFNPKRTDFRPIAESISKVPNSVIFTTRSKGLAVPYFEQKSIEVKKLDETTDLVAQTLADQLAGKKVWIVDTSFAYYSLIEPYLQALKLNQTKYALQIYPYENGETIFVIRIY